MGGLFGGGAGGGGGGGSGAQFNPNAILANQAMGDPYTSQGFDPTAYDPSSFFTNPLDVAQATMGPGPMDSGDMGVGGLQQWPSDLGGQESDPAQGRQTAQGGAAPAGAPADSQSVLAQIAKALNPVSSAQAKEPDQGGSPWVTGGKPQQPIKYTSPEQYLGATPEQPGPAALRPDTGSSFWENRRTSQPQDAPIQSTPVATTTTTPAEQPPAMPPLEPPQAPPTPEPPQSAILSAGATTPRRQAAASAPPAAPPAGPPGPPQGMSPLDIIGQILGIPGQLISSLLGVSQQTTPNYRFNPSRMGQTIGNLGNIIAGHPELVRHGDPRQRQQQAPPAGQQAAQQQIPGQAQQQSQQGPFQHRPDDMNYLTQLGGHAAGAGAPVFSPEMASRLRAAGEAYTKETGQHPQFGELSRSHELQQQYYDEYKRTGKGLAARPGQSRHERGEAADIPEGPFLDWMHKNASRFGLSYLTGKAYAHDPVHTQMAAGFGGAARGTAPTAAATPQRQQIQQTVGRTLQAAGASSNAISGIMANIGDETPWNPADREYDKQGAGEAGYAHGLYQEGGDNWNRYERWLGGRDWRDPQLQTQFLSENLQRHYPQTWARMNAAQTPGLAAQIFLNEYLKPAAKYRAARGQRYGQGVPQYEGAL